MPIEIIGLQRVLRASGAARAKTGKTVAESLEQCAQILLTASQTLVPVLTGELKASGHVEVKGRGLGATASVVYDALHAFIVHEDLRKAHAPPTQARYLADAVPVVRSTMTNVLKRNLLVGLK